MRNKFIFILFFIFTSHSILGDTKSKIEELCNCLKKAKQSNKSEDKKKCLDLREEHFSLIGSKNTEYKKYLEGLNSCENELTGVASVKTEGSLDDKVKEVCDCFSSKKSRPICFQIQSKLAATFKDIEQKKEFNLKSSSCDK